MIDITNDYDSTTYTVNSGVKEEKKYTYGTKCPDFSLIPMAAYESLANRFALGLENYKEKAWNGTSNQDCLLDEKFVKYRLSHAIKHCLLAIGKLSGTIEDDGDDDAGAIMWAGAMLAARNAMLKDKVK